MVEIKDQIENLKSDMNGLTVLVHAFLEGIRLGSVSIDEIINVTVILYLLMEIITDRIKSTKNDLISSPE